MSINIFGEIILLLIVGHFDNDVELERCGTEEKICATVLRPDGSEQSSSGDLCDKIRICVKEKWKK